MDGVSKVGRTIVSRAAFHLPQIDRAATLRFASADIGGGIADEKSPRDRNVQFADSPLHHPTFRFAARALLRRVMWAVIDFRNPDAERRKSTKKLLIHGNEFLGGVVAQSDTLLVRDDRQRKARRL